MAFSRFFCEITRGQSHLALKTSHKIQVFSLCADENHGFRMFPVDFPSSNLTKKTAKRVSRMLVGYSSIMRTSYAMILPKIYDWWLLFLEIAHGNARIPNVSEDVIGYLL